MQMNPDMLAAYRESERAIIEGRPLWATGAFSLAVFGGALGCLLLLLRKSFAVYLFIASLIGVIVTMIHTLGAGIDFSLGEILGIILMPTVVAVFLIWYSKRAESRAWVS
jgi:type III secretory pathway component EscS